MQLRVQLALCELCYTVLNEDCLCSVALNLSAGLCSR